MSQYSAPSYDPLSPGGSTGKAPMAVAAPAAAPVSKVKPINPLNLSKKYWWLLVIAVFLGVGVGVALYLYLDRGHRQYESRATIQVRGQVADATAGPADVAGGGDERGLMTLLTTQAGILTSDEVLGRVLGREAVRRTQWFQSLAGADEGAGADAAAGAARPRLFGLLGGTDVLSTRAELRSIIRATPRRNSSLMDITVTTPSQRDAGIILDELVDTYIAWVQEQNQTQFSDVLTLFREEWAEADRRREAALREINNFRANSGVSDLDAQFNDTESAYQSLVLRRNELTSQLSQTRAYFTSLRSQAAGGITGTMLQEIQAHPAVAGLDMRIRSLRQELEMAQARYGPQHRHSIDLVRMIETAEGERRRKIEELARDRNDALISGAQQALSSIEQNLAEVEAQLPELERRRTELSQLRQQLRQYETNLLVARERLQEAAALLDRNQLLQRRPDLNRVVPLGRAGDPTKTFPKPVTVIGLPVFLFLALVIGVVLLREMLDQKIRSSDCVKGIGDCELLGLIPDAEQTAGEEETEFEDVIRDNPGGMIAESIRRVRTRLNQRIEQTGTRSLMLVSPQPEGGTSSMVANLARSWALQGRRILVIDANVRRPRLHQFLGDGVVGNPGLVGVLASECKLDDAIVRIEREGFDLLPAGPRREVASEFFERAEFRDLIHKLESEYDLILIDVAPALITSDAQLLARSVDGVAIVVRANRDQRGMFGRMVGMFKGSNTQTLGVIINGARHAVGGYFRENFRRFNEYKQDSSASAA